MRSRTNAIGLVAVLALLYVVFGLNIFLISGVISLTTLRQGINEGFGILTAALLVNLLAVWLMYQGHLTQFFLFGIFIIPVFVLAQILRTTSSLTNMIYLGTLVAVLLIVTIYLSVDDVVVWSNQFMSTMAPGYELVEKSEQVSPLGILVLALYLFIWIAGNLLGRWFESLVYHPGHFSREFCAVHAKREFAIPTMLALAVYLTQDGVLKMFAMDLLMIFIATYWLIGLSIVHFIAKQLNIHRSFFVLVYLLNLIPPMQLIVAGTAFLDTWFDFRKNFSGSKKDE